MIDLQRHPFADRPLDHGSEPAWAMVYPRRLLPGPEVSNAVFPGTSTPRRAATPSGIRFNRYYRADIHENSSTLQLPSRPSRTTWATAEKTRNAPGNNPGLRSYRLHPALGTHGDLIEIAPVFQVEPAIGFQRDPDPCRTETKRRILSPDRFEVFTPQPEANGSPIRSRPGKHEPHKATPPPPPPGLPGRPRQKTDR